MRYSYTYHINPFRPITRHRWFGCSKESSHWPTKVVHMLTYRICFGWEISYANSLNPDQARQNVGRDLDPNCLTPWWYSFLESFSKKGNLKKKSADDKKHEKLLRQGQIINLPTNLRVAVWFQKVKTCLAINSVIGSWYNLVCSNRQGWQFNNFMLGYFINTPGRMRNFLQ